ncbi:MAG: enoyl-CoA hydratase/isomerase family protein [Pseudomonadota bacterium]
MDYKYIIYEKEGEISRVILNRPEKLNVMDFAGDGGIYDEFLSALDRAADDDDVKVVIIKGAGRSFCAGHNLDRIYKVYEEQDTGPEKRRPSQRARLRIDRKWLEGHHKILLFPKITIAQVHGHCVGEGALIAENCDIAIVADDAHISHAEQRLGFAGSGVNLMPLYQLVGYKRARWMCLSGDAIDGKEAERIGWATKSVSPEELEKEVEAVAKRMTLLPKDGIAIGKASNFMIVQSLGLTEGLGNAIMSHTLFTNLRFEPGEYNFVKKRKDEGTREGIHKRDERYIKKR